MYSSKKAHSNKDVAPYPYHTLTMAQVETNVAPKRLRLCLTTVVRCLHLVTPLSIRRFLRSMYDLAIHDMNQLQKKLDGLNKEINTHNISSELDSTISSLKESLAEKEKVSTKKTRTHR